MEKPEPAAEKDSSAPDRTSAVVPSPPRRKNGKSLVIVESPGKIRTIAKVLGGGYVVKASIGHVRDLPKSAKEDRRSSLVIGVEQDFTPRYVVLANKRRVLNELKKASAGAQRVFLCPDPDREGEAIAWHLQQALELEPERTFRVTFDEITPRGIRAGFAQPRAIDMDLVNAQQARRVLDRLVGYKLSPLLSKKLGGWLTAGRVQSVAVKLIVLREREIQGFKPEEYWTIGARFEHEGREFNAQLRSLDGGLVVAGAEDLGKYKSRQADSAATPRALIATREEAGKLAEVLRGAKYVVAAYEVKEAADRPYPPFATSQLQQAAANRLGFDARRTMRIAQELYQGVTLGEEGSVALITYMRTDSFRISQDAVADCRKMIGQRFGEQYLPEKPNYFSSRKGAQEAHECIRPTHVERAPEQLAPHLTPEQFRLYRLIWERFAACQMRPALFDAVVCDIAAEGPECRGAVFRATGRSLKFDGWLAVYGGAVAVAASHLEAAAADREKGDETEEGEAGNGKPAGESPAPAGAPPEPARGFRSPPPPPPPMKVGDRPALREIKPEGHFTEPPPRYTEASLIRTLEREGIGRPSTYASIVSNILDRGYVVKTGGGRGVFRPTPLGATVFDRLEDGFSHSIMDLGFTRWMESELDKIEEAHLDWRAALGSFYGPFKEDLEKAGRQLTAERRQVEKTDVPCPRCGALMEKRLSRFGFYLRCPKPGCDGRRSLSEPGQEQAPPRPTGLKCDLCGAEMVKANGRFGPYLCCAKYPAKQCAFTMKLNRQGLPVRRFAPSATELKCEKCGKPAVIRVTVRGKNRQARPFLSCSAFPKCRTAKDLPPELKEQGEKALVRWRDLEARNRADAETYRRSPAGLEDGEGRLAGGASPSRE